MDKCPPLTTEDIRNALRDPTCSVYLCVGMESDQGWENAELVFGLLSRLRIYLVEDRAVVKEWVGAQNPSGIVFGWTETPVRLLTQEEANDLNIVLKAITEARGQQ